MNIFTAIENLIAPEFDGKHNGLDLSRAFRLLVRAVIVFGLAIALRSLAAGLLEAGKWTGGSFLEERYFDWWGWPNWLLVC